MKCDYENTYARKSSSVPNRWYSALMDDLARVQAASDANNGQYRNGARTLSDRLSPPPPHAANSSERRLNNNYKRKTPLRSPNITNSTGTLKASAKAKKASPESSFCEAVKLKGRCHADGGPHWRVQESAHFGNALQRGRKWHPTVGMHLLRAEMLVFSYVHIIMDALLMVEADAQRAGALAAVGVVDISKSKNKKKKNKKASKVSSASAVPVGCSAAAEASSKGRKELFFLSIFLKALQKPFYSLFLNFFLCIIVQNTS